MEIAHDGHLVKIRSGANVTDIVIGPGKRTVDDIVTALTAVPGVLAAPSDAGVHYDLPWPATVQDPADESDPRPPDSDPAHAAFVKIPDDPDKPYVLRHAADEDLTTRYGFAGPRRSPFDGVAWSAAGWSRPTPTTRCSGPQPISPCSSGSAPRPGCALSNRSPPTPRWSRRRRRWPGRSGRSARCSATGTSTIGASTSGVRSSPAARRREVAPPADAALAEGARVAEAMGWVGLWRAWLRVASDTTQDTGARLPSPDTPVVRAADGSSFRPTNEQLTAGIRYLLDLPA